MLLSKPDRIKTIAYKWSYKKKGVPGVELPRFKLRLVVARGYTQREGIDFTEIFSPMVKHIFIRIFFINGGKFRHGTRTVRYKNCLLTW